jgi:hypothetical protein
MANYAAAANSVIKQFNSHHCGVSNSRTLKGVSAKRAGNINHTSQCVQCVAYCANCFETSFLLAWFHLQKILINCCFLPVFLWIVFLCLLHKISLHCAHHPMRKKYQFGIVRDYFPAVFLFCSPDRRFRIALSGSSVTLPLPRTKCQNAFLTML